MYLFVDPIVIKGLAERNVKKGAELFPDKGGEGP